jgi:hypothetical protein
MPPIRSTAFPAAVMLTLIAGACQDALVEPRARALATETAALAAPVHFRTFSGQRADSVLDALDAVWARAGHSEYRERRLAWRKENGVPAHVDDPALGRPGSSNADVYDDGSPKPPPSIFSHNEAIHFGSYHDGVRTPGSLEAEMVFIGDAGDISGTITITSNNGATYPVSGTIATGPGQLVSCYDVTFGGCQNRRHLNGVLLLDRVPYCDASGSGSVNYYANNINPPLGLSVPFTTVGGSTEGGASTLGYVNGTAESCQTEDNGGQRSDPGVDAGTGGSGPPPAPTGPGLPPSPPPYTPQPIYGAPVQLWCQTTNVYTFVDGTLFESVIDCYPIR